MGHIFANLLVAGGLHVTAYDLDQRKIQMVAKEGVTAASAISDFSGCEVVLTSLPDDDAVRAVALSEAGLISVLRPGSIHLSTSTIGVAFCRKLDAAHRERGQTLVASLLHDRLVAVEARGWSDLDWSAVGRFAAFEAGIADL